MKGNRWRWEETPEAAVNVMREGFGKLRVVVQNADVVAGARMYGITIHEVHADVLVDGEAVKIREQMPLSWFKRWGIVKRWDSFSKSEAFLNSELGKEWFGYFLQENKAYLFKDVAG